VARLGRGDGAGRGRAPADRKDVVVDGLVVRVTSKPIRHLYLRVRDGTVEVSAPLGTPVGRIRDAVRARRAWLETQIARDAERERRARDRDAAAEVLVWGRPVRVESGASGPWRVELVNEALVVDAPPQATQAARARAVERWLRRELTGELERLLTSWQAAMGLHARRVTVRPMTSRWGSCRPASGRLTFNADLVHHEPAALEYVVVHELAHLAESGHGPGFQALMTRFLPDWRARRRALRPH